MQQQPPATKTVVPLGGGMACSASGSSPIYVVTTDSDGYGFSLSRFSADPVIELMVEDQTNCPTSNIAAELCRDRLQVELDPGEAAEIGIPAKYLVPLAAAEAELSQLDSTLRAIFSGVGVYSRKY
jgi:hypothetical protein